MSEPITYGESMWSCTWRSIWKVQNEARAVERLSWRRPQRVPSPAVTVQRQLERGRVQCGDRAGAGAAQAGGADQDRPAGRAQAGGTASGGAVDRGAAADAGRGSSAATCAGLVMTHARIGSGAGTGSANCCFAEGCTIRVARGPRRTGAGSMVFRIRRRVVLATTCWPSTRCPTGGVGCAGRPWPPPIGPVGWLRWGHRHGPRAAARRAHDVQR